MIFAWAKPDRVFFWRKDHARLELLERRVQAMELDALASRVKELEIELPGMVLADELEELANRVKALEGTRDGPTGNSLDDLETWRKARLDHAGS